MRLSSSPSTGRAPCESTSSFRRAEGTLAEPQSHLRRGSALPAERALKLTRPLHGSGRGSQLCAFGVAERVRSESSDHLDVDGLGTLVPGLGLVGDLGALGERAIALADDRRMMGEQILG